MLGMVSLHGIPRHLLLAAARLPENAGAARTLLERATPPCPAPTTPPERAVAQDTPACITRPPEWDSDRPCASCGKMVEAVRRCYAVPTCYACLPPPRAMEVFVPENALRVILPLPAKALHPNARVHWRVKHKATKEARRKAFFAGWEALVKMGKPCALAPPMWEAATVQIVWVAKTRRWPDPDNALAATKAYMDGLAAPTHNGIGAGIIANDSGFSFLPVKMETERENPRVEIYVWRT